MENTQKVYREEYWSNYYFILSAILLLTVVGIPISIILVFVGLYYKFLIRECIISNKIIIRKKFITEQEYRNNYSNCIEHDIIKNKQILDVLFKTSLITVYVKIRRGINEYSNEAFSIRLKDADVEAIIQDIDNFFNSIKVKI